MCVSVPCPVGPLSPGTDLQVMSGHGVHFLRSLESPSNSAFSTEGGNCGSVRSFLDSPSGLGGAQFGWVGSGGRVPTVSGWRPDVFAQGCVTTCSRKAYCSAPHSTPPLRAPPQVYAARGRGAGALDGGSRMGAEGTRLLDSGGGGRRRGVVRAAAHWRSVDRA